MREEVHKCSGPGMVCVCVYWASAAFPCSSLQTTLVYIQTVPVQVHLQILGKFSC